MLILETSRYLGANLSGFDTDGVYVHLTQYTHENLSNDSLHAHVNPHLSFLLNGGTLENRAGDRHERKAGDIVFFSAGEPHQNNGTAAGSKNINFEFEPSFFKRYGTDETAIEKAIRKKAPQTKFLLLKAYKELTLGDNFAGDSINMLLLYLMHAPTSPGKPGRADAVPVWVTKVGEYLNDRWRETVSLQELSLAAGVHPVTISKHFPRYFSCTLGEYLRGIKIEKALPLIKSSGLSLADIAYECGFADQSHFIRTFRSVTGFLPNNYRRL